MAARHNAMPFGCTGVVCFMQCSYVMRCVLGCSTNRQRSRLEQNRAHADDFCSTLPCAASLQVASLAHIGFPPPSSLLYSACRYRWVDDYFSIEPADTVKHAMTCFARLVRAVLGTDAIAESKLGWGNPLHILGVTIAIRDGRLDVKLTREKEEKRAAVVERILAEECMTRKEADQLAGRFSFAAQCIFFRLGRAMLRPLFAKRSSKRPHTHLGPELVMALRWWLRVLRNGISQKRSLEKCSEVVDLFCDAASTPPKVAAILAIKGRLVYTDWEVPPSVMSMFVRRPDKQIMGLELLAILIGH